MIFDGDGEAFPKFPKQKVCNVFTISRKRNQRDEVNFLHADKHQSFLQVAFNVLITKVSLMVILSLLIGLIKHSQITQSNKSAISLQYLEKELMDGVHFLHADKHLCFYKLALSFLMEVTRHVQSTFCKILRKKCYLISSVENKKACIQKITGDKFF